MTAIEYVPLVLYIVVYGVVFIIQKAQNDKQKSIMEKYEKMFSIINIDEIDKYVKLREQSLKLNFEVREQEVEKIEKEINSQLDRTMLLGDESKTLIDELKSLKAEKLRIEAYGDKLDIMLANSSIIQQATWDIYIEEFDKIYNLIKVRLKSIDKLEANQIKTELEEIRKEYASKKLEIIGRFEKPIY